MPINPFLGMWTCRSCLWTCSTPSFCQYPYAGQHVSACSLGTTHHLQEYETVGRLASFFGFADHSVKPYLEEATKPLHNTRLTSSHSRILQQGYPAGSSPLPLLIRFIRHSDRIFLQPNSSSEPPLTRRPLSLTLSLSMW